MITNEIERKELYDKLSIYEQWMIDNRLDDNYTYELWSIEYYGLICNNDHEYEYRYHYSEGGVLQLFSQCTTCGKKRDKGGSLKHSTIDNFRDNVIRGEINKFDTELFDKYYASYERYNNYQQFIFYKERKISADKREEDRTKWFKEHNEYLQTDKWKQIRLKVLKRDDFLCQGCLESPATEVHHLTYGHWKNELMFELLSVCYDCHHNRIHKQ